MCHMAVRWKDLNQLQCDINGIWSRLCDLGEERLAKTWERGADNNVFKLHPE